MERKLSLTEQTNRLLTDQARAWAKRHLSPSGKRGRPAVVSEYVGWLLREQVKPPEPPRATLRATRARKVDRAATGAFARAWRATPTKLHPFQDVEPIVRSIVPSADRPQRIFRATQGFCDRQVLAPFTVHLDRTVDSVPLPRMDLIPDYHYGLWTFVQTTLGDFP